MFELGTKRQQKVFIISLFVCFFVGTEWDHWIYSLFSLLHEGKGGGVELHDAFAFGLNIRVDIVSDGLQIFVFNKLIKSSGDLGLEGKLSLDFDFPGGLGRKRTDLLSLTHPNIYNKCMRMLTVKINLICSQLTLCSSSEKYADLTFGEEYLFK